MAIDPTDFDGLLQAAMDLHDQLLRAARRYMHRYAHLFTTDEDYEDVVLETLWKFSSKVKDGTITFSAPVVEEDLFKILCEILRKEQTAFMRKADRRSRLQLTPQAKLQKIPDPHADPSIAVAHELRETLLRLLGGEATQLPELTQAVLDSSHWIALGKSELDEVDWCELFHALYRLHPREKQIISGLIQNNSWDDIASLLGISRDAARVACSRVRHKLKSLIPRSVERRQFQRSVGAKRQRNSFNIVFESEPSREKAIEFLRHLRDRIEQAGGEITGPLVLERDD